MLTGIPFIAIQNYQYLPMIILLILVILWFLKYVLYMTINKYMC
jgi:hypothetical protein